MQTATFDTTTHQRTASYRFRSPDSTPNSLVLNIATWVGNDIVAVDDEWVVFYGPHARPRVASYQFDDPTAIAVRCPPAKAR